MVVKRILR
jgi:hypothetical protein